MQQLDSLAIIALAATVHASFQLSVSMFTVMSGHALSRKASHARLLRLSGSFILGVLLMIVLLLIGALFAIERIVGTGGEIPLITWAIASGLSVGVGVAVWAFYYRHRHSGTVLWLPRPFARFLEKRARRTKQAPEAFSLGMSSVVAELLFISAPGLIAALLLAGLPVHLQLSGLGLYVLIAGLPLWIIYFLVGGGHSLARIQHWRETNKRFLQFFAGSVLLVLGAYVYVDIVLGAGSVGRLW